MVFLPGILFTSFCGEKWWYICAIVQCWYIHNTHTTCLLVFTVTLYFSISVGDTPSFVRQSHCRLPTSHKNCKLTDFDVLVIKLADLTLETLQPPLNPAGSPEHHSCLHLDAQEDVAGMPRKIGKLVNYVGQCLTANFIQ